MSTTSKEVEASAQKIEISFKAKAHPLLQLSSDMIRLSGSFMNDLELKNCCEAVRFFHTSCQEDMKKRKKVRKELLPHVAVFTMNEVTSNPIDQFFNTPNTEANMVLVKTSFREGYDSKECNEFICFREYRAVSALQMAAHCGDQFLLIELLSRVLKKEHGVNYRMKALEQLEAVHKRISNQDILLNAVNTISEIEFGENDDVKVHAKLRFEEIKESEVFQKIMKEFIDEMEELRRKSTAKKTEIQKRGTSDPCNDASDIKSETERKVIAENTPIKYADDSEVLEPVLKLIKAYIYYYLQHPQLFKHFLSPENNLARLEQLWEYVGECQRKLPHYFIQEFFNKPFSIDPLTSFEIAPRRQPLTYGLHDRIDLDGLGIGTHLSMTADGEGSKYAVRLVLPLWFGIGSEVALNITVLAHLYKLRITGLGNIIELLREPEITNTLIIQKLSEGCLAGNVRTKINPLKAD